MNDDFTTCPWYPSTCATLAWCWRNSCKEDGEDISSWVKRRNWGPIRGFPLVFHAYSQMTTEICMHGCFQSPLQGSWITWVNLTRIVICSLRKAWTVYVQDSHNTILQQLPRSVVSKSISPYVLAWYQRDTRSLSDIVYCGWQTLHLDWWWREEGAIWCGLEDCLRRIRSIFSCFWSVELIVEETDLTGGSKQTRVPGDLSEERSRGFSWVQGHPRSYNGTACCDLAGPLRVCAYLENRGSISLCNSVCSD